MAILAHTSTSFRPSHFDQISLEARHPDKLRLELAGDLSRGERRVYDKCWTWLTEDNAPLYLTLSRAWLARECRVSISTVARAFAAFRRLGLLLVKERWRRVGNLRRQVSNLLALPFQRPLVPPTDRAQARSHPERVKSKTQTIKHKKKTQNKVASGRFLDRKPAAAVSRGGFISAQTILKQWAERGFPVGETKARPES